MNGSSVGMPATTLTVAVAELFALFGSAVVLGDHHMHKRVGDVVAWSDDRRAGDLGHREIGSVLTVVVVWSCC